MASAIPATAGPRLSSEESKDYTAQYRADADQRAYKAAAENVDQRIHCRDRAINMCIVGLFERHSMTPSLQTRVFPMKRTESEIFARTLVRNWQTDRRVMTEAKLRSPSDAGALFLILYTFFPWNDWADWSYANEGLRRLQHMHRDIDELSMPTIKKKSILSDKMEDERNYRYHKDIAANYKVTTDALKDQAKVTEAFFKEVRSQAKWGVAKRLGLMAIGVLTISGFMLSAYRFAFVALAILGLAVYRQYSTQANKDEALSAKAEAALFPVHPFMDTLQNPRFEDLYFQTFIITQGYSSISVV